MRRFSQLEFPSPLPAPVAKKYWDGTHRVVSLREKLARIQPFFSKMRSNQDEAVPTFAAGCLRGGRQRRLVFGGLSRDSEAPRREKALAGCLPAGLVALDRSLYRAARSRPFRQSTEIRALPAVFRASIRSGRPTFATRQFRPGIGAPLTMNALPPGRASHS